MAITSTIYRKSAVKGNGRSNSNRSTFDWKSVRIDTDDKVILQLMEVEDYIDTEYGNPEDDYRKIRLKWNVVIPGWEEAMWASEEEQNAFRVQGHGKLVSTEYNPKATRPGINKAKGTATNASNLYKDLTAILGREPSDEELGLNASKQELATFTAEWNAAAQAHNAQTRNEDEYQLVITTDFQAQVLFQAQKLRELLNRLEQEKPFVYADLEERVAKKSGNTYYRVEKLKKFTGKTKPASYQLYPKPMDPREEGAPVISCEVDPTQRVRGYENNEGEWVSAEEAAEASRKRYGKVMSGLTIWRLRQAGQLVELEQTSNDEADTEDDEGDDDLPF